MAGQAGLEPATTGFGVRRSSQLELLTLVPLNLDLAVLRMSPASCAILFKGQLFSGGLSVFRRRIVLALAFIASETD